MRARDYMSCAVGECFETGQLEGLTISYLRENDAFHSVLDYLPPKKHARGTHNTQNRKQSLKQTTQNNMKVSENVRALRRHWLKKRRLWVW